MKLKLITAPTAMPVTLDDAKAFMRVLGNEEDTVITRAIQAATEKAEQITNRQLVQATYEGYLDGFASDVVLPKPPLMSVNGVSYVSTAGTVKAFTDYEVDDVAEPAVIHFGSTPSDVRTTGVNNVIVNFTCGYESVPDAVASWVLSYATTLYENRQFKEVGVSGEVDFSEHLNHLLDSYRIIPV